MCINIPACAFFCLSWQARRGIQDQGGWVRAFPRQGGVAEGILEPGRTDGLSASPLMLLRYACRPLKSTWWCCTRRYIQTAYTLCRARGAESSRVLMGGAPQVILRARRARVDNTHTRCCAALCMVCVCVCVKPWRTGRERKGETANEGDSTPWNEPHFTFN